MLRPEALLIFCVHLVFSSPKSNDEASSEQEWYSPAFEGDPLVFKTTLNEQYQWIDPSIQQELQEFNDIAAEKFASRIEDLCGRTLVLGRAREIVMGILNPSESPTYLNILPQQCSAKITAAVPYLLADPYYRVLAGFQNWKGNDAYHEAILSKQKDKIYNLSKIIGLPVNNPNIYGITPMLAACRFCTYYEAKRILKSEIEPGRHDPHGRTALHLAAKYCSSVKLFRLLIERGKFDINSQDVQGNTPLHLAYLHVLNGDHNSISIHDEATSITGSYNSNSAESVLEYIILRVSGLDPNIQNREGDSVLHLAAHELDGFLIEQLLSRDLIDATIEDARGFTALDIVYELGNTVTLPHEVGKFAASLVAFIKNGVFVDPVQRFGSDGNTVLHLMCQELQHSALSALLRLPNIDVNVENYAGRIPFQVAFEKDDYSIGKLTTSFLENIRTNVAVKLNDDDDTILHVACRTRNLSTVKSLMAYPRVPLNVYNLHGHVPLHDAYKVEDPAMSGPISSWGNYRASLTETFVIDTLLQHPRSDPNIPNNEKDALIHIACRRQDYATVKRLLKLKRTNVNMRGYDGKSPIQIAFDYEDLRLIDQQILQKHSQEDLDNPAQSILGLLLQNERVVPDIRIGSEQNTLLHHACDWPNTAAVRLLLDNPNTSVNEKNSSGRTALWIAYQRDQRDGGCRIGRVSKILTECPRVDASVPVNKAGDTLLHVACRTGDIAGIQYLLSLQNINVNAVHERGNTPFQMAFFFDQSTEGAHSRFNEPYIGALTRRLLADPRLNCNVPIDEHHNTILHLLTKFKHYDLSIQKDMSDLVGQVLSLNDVDPNLENDEGLTPLHYAYRNEGFSLIKNSSGNPGILRLLLKDQRTNPNIPIGKHGGTILHLACLQTQLEAVELLLNHPNIDIMVQDGQATIPFELALEMKNKEDSLESRSIINKIYEAGHQRLNKEGKAVLAEALTNDLRVKEEELSKKKKFIWYKISR